MDLSTGRLEGSERIQDRPFGKPSEEQKRRTPHRPKDDAGNHEADELAEEREEHQLDNIA